MAIFPPDDLKWVAPSAHVMQILKDGGDYSLSMDIKPVKKTGLFISPSSSKLLNNDQLVKSDVGGGALSEETVLKPWQAKDSELNGVTGL